MKWRLNHQRILRTLEGVAKLLYSIIRGSNPAQYAHLYPKTGHIDSAIGLFLSVVARNFLRRPPCRAPSPLEAIIFLVRYYLE
jgi:hypothetical protein